MRLKIFCSLLLMVNCCYSTIYSQYVTVDSVENEFKEIVKASAYSLGNFFTPAIQFSYEKEYKKDRSWQLEVGYINDFNYDIWDQRLNGFRARFEYREYRHHFNQLSYYHGFAVQTKQTLAQNEEWVSRYNFSYTELLEYSRLTSSFGVFFAHGFQSNIKDVKGVVDYGAMYGFRAMHRQYYNFPVDAERMGFEGVGLRQGWHFFPAIFPILRFGIKL